jgi:hypothetical protein
LKKVFGPSEHLHKEKETSEKTRKTFKMCLNLNGSVKILRQKIDAANWLVILSFADSFVIFIKPQPAKSGWFGVWVDLPNQGGVRWPRKLSEFMQISI